MISGFEKVEEPCLLGSTKRSHVWVPCLIKHGNVAGYPARSSMVPTQVLTLVLIPETLVLTMFPICGGYSHQTLLCMIVSRRLPFAFKSGWA